MQSILLNKVIQHILNQNLKCKKSITLCKNPSYMNNQVQICKHAWNSHNQAIYPAVRRARNSEWQRKIITSKPLDIKPCIVE